MASSSDHYGRAPESEVIGRAIRQRFFKTRRGRVYRLLFMVQDEEVTILRIRGPGQPPISADEIEGKS